MCAKTEYNEPWGVWEFQWWISDCDGKRIEEWSHDDGWDQPPAIRDRIIACVNACQGIPTEDLEECYTVVPLPNKCPHCGEKYHWLIGSGHTTRLEHHCPHYRLTIEEPPDAD